MSDEEVFNLIKEIEPLLIGRPMGVALGAMSALLLTAIQNSGVDPQEICDYLMSEARMEVTEVTKN